MRELAEHFDTLEIGTRRLPRQLFPRQERLANVAQIVAVLVEVVQLLMQENTEAAASKVASLPSIEPRRPEGFQRALRVAFEANSRYKTELDGAIAAEDWDKARDCAAVCRETLSNISACPFARAVLSAAFQQKLSALEQEQQRFEGYLHAEEERRRLWPWLVTGSAKKRSASWTVSLWPTEAVNRWQGTLRIVERASDAVDALRPPEAERAHTGLPPAGALLTKAQALIEEVSKLLTQANAAISESESATRFFRVPGTACGSLDERIKLASKRSKRSPSIRRSLPQSSSASVWISGTRRSA